MSDKKKTPAPTPPMTSWDMACSLLVGTRQAIAHATDEHEAIRTANEGRLFLSNASTIADTIGILRSVENLLDYELSRTARSAGLSVPSKEAS